MIALAVVAGIGFIMQGLVTCALAMLVWRLVSFDRANTLRSFITGQARSAAPTRPNAGVQAQADLRSFDLRKERKSNETVITNPLRQG